MCQTALNMINVVIIIITYIYCTYIHSTETVSIGDIMIFASSKAVYLK